MIFKYSDDCPRCKGWGVYYERVNSKIIVDIKGVKTEIPLVEDLTRECACRRQAKGGSDEVSEGM